MHEKSHDNAVRPIDTLLALCARAQGHPAQHDSLARLARQLPSWAGIAARAEAHGLIPLLSSHLHAAGIALPGAIKQQVQGYYLQHAHATRAREQVLAELLTLYQGAGIDVLVLKGAALAQLVYPQPVLRPMRDIDILVRASDVYRAHALLAEIGFTPPSSPMAGLAPDHHHLTAIKRVVDGFSVSVEVHQALDINQPGRPPREYAELAPAAQPLTIGGVATHTLGCEDTLWHIYRHAFCMPAAYEPLRLIWVADLVSLVEAWLDRIDWERVQRQYPAAYALLPLLDALTPWGDAARARLRAEAPAPPLLPAELERQRWTAQLEETLGYVADLRAQMTRLQAMLGEQDTALALWHAELDARAGYIAQLEATVDVKNAHIHDLEARLRQREAELVRARAPRWWWKRRRD
ncbi:MAG: nucleotidyltransferase family protein [Roseiflexaceae bacterium]